MLGGVAADVEIAIAVDEIEDRAKKVLVTDTSAHSNQGAQFVRHLFNMIVIARVIAQGARNRDESRGAHFKPAFKDRNDAAWLRTTLAFHKPSDGKNGRSGVEYRRSLDYSLAGQRVHVTDAVDTSLVQPRARKYETAGAASASAKGELGAPDTKAAAKAEAPAPRG